MRRRRALRWRLAGLFQKERRDRELAEEIESHLQMHVEDNLRSGLSPEDARRDTLLRLGGIEATKESHRDRRGMPVLENLVRDRRYALRVLARSPGFTAVAVLALALGIGVNTTVFTAFDAVALRPLSVESPDHLARVFRTTPQDPHGALSYPDYVDYRDRNRVFSDLSMQAFGGRSLHRTSPSGTPKGAPASRGSSGSGCRVCCRGAPVPSAPASCPATTFGCWAPGPCGVG